MKFEIDQLSKKLQSCKQENETLKSDLHVSDGHCCDWWLYSESVVPVCDGHCCDWWLCSGSVVPVCVL